MDTIKVYSASELKELFPEGFESAHKSWCEDHASDIFWQNEIIESMKALFEKSGVNLRDYSIGDSNSWLKCEISSYEYDSDEDNSIGTGDLTGNQAYAWIKENLIDGAKFKRVNYKYENESGRKVSGWRYDLTKVNGESWSCEFTGVCYDHDFIDSLLDDIKSGCTLHEAFCNLASEAQKLTNNEIEDQMSESYFVNHADANDYKFTESGQQVY